MASSKSSTSCKSSFMSTNSESENDILSSFQLDTSKINLSKTFSSSLASNLSRQTSNNSLKYFKKQKLKKKKIKSNKPSTQFKNKFSTSPYSLRPRKPENHSTVLKNEKIKFFKNKSTTYSSLIDLSQEYAKAFQSSSDSDFPDLKYLKRISKNNEINTSTVSKESKQSKSSSSTTNKKQFTIINSPKMNNKKFKHLESSTSSNSLDFSRINVDNVNFSKKEGRNNELNLDELLSDCSLSDDELFIRDDSGKRNSRVNPTLDTGNLFLRSISKSPEPLPLNISLEFDNLPLPQTLSNVILNIPDLTNGGKENEPNQFAEDIEMTEQERILNNDYSKTNETKLSLGGDELNDSGLIPNSLKSMEESSSKERVCSHCNRSNRLKNSSNINSETDLTIKKRNKSKRPREKAMANTSDFLQIKRSFSTNKSKNHNTTNKTEYIPEDIGLEYDTEKDNYMVELPNGAIVPAFLSTLKSKEVKKLCACGITSSEIPDSWSESFHNILHLHMYKLRFKGNLTDYETINFKEKGLCYKIIILCANHYNDENIKTSIKDVDDFVSLEYGISKTGIQLYKHLTYFAVLPNFKVIGFLQVEPIQQAYLFTLDEQPLEKTLSVKFGISKIWVLIKYRKKNIDVNLMESFREKEKLEKSDLAFSLDGCQGVQFIQEYTETKNILIYNTNSA